MARDLTKLNPIVESLAYKLVTECAKEGLNIKITDCVRNKVEQNGINASRTNCKYPKSYHNFGLAFDFCRNEDVDKDGKISDDAYNTSGNFFSKVGQIGKSLGLNWGGDFQSIVDLPHFEYKGLGTRLQIEIKYGTPEKFFTSWKGETTKIISSPIKSIVKKNDWIARIQAELNCKADNVAGKITLSKTITIKRGDKGDVVKLIQERLTALGYDTKGIDGIYGDKPYFGMYNAVVKFQKEVIKMKYPDGEFTAKGASWKALLGLK